MLRVRLTLLVFLETLNPKSDINGIWRFRSNFFFHSERNLYKSSESESKLKDILTQ